MLSINFIKSTSLLLSRYISIKVLVGIFIYPFFPFIKISANLALKFSSSDFNSFIISLISHFAKSSIIFFLKPSLNFSAILLSYSLNPDISLFNKLKISIIPLLHYFI